MNLAPIVLFVYNRPWHTEQTLQSLSSNILAGESELIVYADGPKEDATPDELDNIKKVREIAYRQKWPLKLTVHLSDTNSGLANAVIKGICSTLQQYNRIIVLEDDMVLSPYFLQFMNEALDKYEHCYEVISIHSYCLQIEYPGETFFLKGADCWGWATWKRGWQLFDPDGMHLMKQLREQNSLYEFDLQGCYDYSGMLQKQIDGEINSWAIRWYASAFIHNKLTLYPGRSLIVNIGTDRSGTHDQNERMHRTNISDNRIVLEDIPIAESKLARKLISQKLFKHLGIKGKLKKIFKWGY